MKEQYEIQELIRDEVSYADKKYGPFASAHEGYGVLLEEAAELREAIHANKSESIIHEAAQVSAVAFRLALSMSEPDTLKRSGCK